MTVLVYDKILSQSITTHWRLHRHIPLHNHVLLWTLHETGAWFLFIQYLYLKTEPFYLRYNNLVSCAHASSYYVCLVIFLFVCFWKNLFWMKKLFLYVKFSERWLLDSDYPGLRGVSWPQVVLLIIRIITMFAMIFMFVLFWLNVWHG